MAFYITLPSNSSKTFFPENTPSHFFTQIPQTIDLQGDGWEVGLAELSLPNTYDNMTGDDYWVEVSVVNTDELIKSVRQYSGPISFKVFLPRGLYNSPRDVIEVLNHQIQSQPLGFALKRKIAFYFGRFNRKVSLEMQVSFIKVVMSKSLQELLGMGHEDYLGSGQFEGIIPFHMEQDFSTVFVYCNLLEERIVGDVNVPLLREVSMDTRYKSIVHRQYDKPFYIPLKIRQFQSIEILITGDNGQPISFVEGKTVATLHFRQKTI